MRRGQYSILWFISILFVLLTLIGIVSDRLVDNSAQVLKAQEVLKVADLVQAVRSIQKQERQVGADYAGIHLGSIGLWPHGVSPCGVSMNLSTLQLDKYIPYWKSAKDTEEYYNYIGYRFNEVPGDDWVAYRFDNVREADYMLQIGDGKETDIGWFLVNGEPVNGSPDPAPFHLVGGNHLIILSDNSSPDGLCTHSIPEALLTDNGTPYCNDPDFKTDYPAGINLNDFHSDNPPLMILQRVISQETCYPDPYFIKNTFEEFVDQNFKTIDDFALTSIRNPASFGTYTADDVKINFAPVDYKTLIEDNPVTPEIEGFGNNTIFINFFPLNVPFFTVKFKGDYADINYKGSTYIFDAFDSDFARFRTASIDAVKNSVIESIVNEVLLYHSFFELRVKVPIEGSSNMKYEEYLNNTPYDSKYNYYGFNIEDYADWEEVFGEGFTLKPMCFYILKEVCQYFSDDVYNYKSVNEGNDSSGLYESLTLPEWGVKGLPGIGVTCEDEYIEECNPETYADYIDPSNPYIAGPAIEPVTSWGKLLYNCGKCHALPYSLNPCLNLSYTPCINCYGTFFSLFVDQRWDRSYFPELSDEILSGSYEYSFNDMDDSIPDPDGEPDITYTSIGIPPPTCDYAVRTSFIPMLTELLKSRFHNVGSMLEDKYPGVKWWVDINKINVTEITFKGVDETDLGETPYFNSSCSDCEDISEFTDCRPFINNLRADSLLLSNYESELNDDYIYSSDKTLTIDELWISRTSDGNAFNDELIIDVFFDVNNDSLVFPEEGYAYYYNQEALESPPFYKFPEEYVSVELSDFVVSTELISDLELLSGEELYDALLGEGLVAPPFVEFLKHSHGLIACVRTPYSDDFDFSNNCMRVTIEYCADGDVSEACCVDVYGAAWFEPDGNGLCCGDDTTYDGNSTNDDSVDSDDDDFMIGENKFCYGGTFYDCGPSTGIYIAARVRPASEAKNYEAQKIDYYCTGGN